MKKLAACFCAAALSLAVMSVTAFADGGVAVDEENFPDEKFRAYVSENCDIDKDGSLSGDEAAAVKEINCSAMGIAYLDGIENFTALEKLDCSENKELIWFDISKNTALKELFCNGCDVSEVNISDNQYLLQACVNGEIEEHEDYYIKRLPCDDGDYSGGSGYYTLSLNKTTAIMADTAKIESIRGESSVAETTSEESSELSSMPEFTVSDISIPEVESKDDGEKFPLGAAVGIAVAAVAVVGAAIAGIVAVKKRK